MARTALARRTGAASLLAALALLTGCTGSDGEAPAAGPGQDAPPAAELEALDPAELYPAVIDALRAAESFAFTSVSSTEGAEAAAASIQGVMRYSDDGIEMRASATGSQALEMLLVDRALYVQGDGLELGDKSWLKVDVSEDSANMLGVLAKVSDPGLLLEATAEPRSFELVGQEDLGEVATNHYAVVVDTAAYAEALELPTSVTEYLPETIGMQLWVDGDNLPRRLVQQIETTVPGGSSGGATATASTEGTYSDFGVDVDIEAPPVGDVTEDIGLTGPGG